MAWYRFTCILGHSRKFRGPGAQRRMQRWVERHQHPMAKLAEEQGWIK